MVASSQRPLQNSCFWLIGIPTWLPWSLIWLRLSSVTAERNSTKLDRREVLNLLYQICVLEGGWGTIIRMCSIPKWGAEVHDRGSLGLLFDFHLLKFSFNNKNLKSYFWWVPVTLIALKANARRWKLKMRLSIIPTLRIISWNLSSRTRDQGNIRKQQNHFVLGYTLFTPIFWQ